MRKIFLALIATVSLLSTSCNNKLENSEEFVGSYISHYNTVGSVTIETFMGDYSIPIDEQDITTFSIILGQADNEVIIVGLEGTSGSVVGIVDKKKITFEETYTDTFEGALMTATSTGSGHLEEDKLTYTITTTGTGTASVEGMSVSAKINLVTEGVATED